MADVLPGFAPTLLLIPLISGLIGWCTNWLAVRMTFAPLDFTGIGRVGWQGIVPARARRMAAIAVDTGISKLGSLEEIADAFDPDRIAEHLALTIDPLVPDIVDQLGREGDRARWWSALPPPAREAVVQRVQNRLPGALRRFMHEATARVEELVDVRLMVVDLLGERRDLVVRMFREAGDQEFRFLTASGFWFGALLGLPQMLLVWGVGDALPAMLVLPLAGLLVGFATNRLALWLIFEPVRPRRWFGVTVQGLFLRRQQEVAEVYCRLVTREVLTLRNFVERMLGGPRSDRTRALVARHIAELVDESMGVARPAVQFAVGRHDLRQLELAVEERALTLTATSFDDPAFAAERAAIVEVRMRERMIGMPPDEFAGMLRPVFREDEFTLVLVGAALGGVAGLLQAALLF